MPNPIPIPTIFADFLAYLNGDLPRPAAGIIKDLQGQPLLHLAIIPVHNWKAEQQTARSLVSAMVARGASGIDVLVNARGGAHYRMFVNDYGKARLVPSASNSREAVLAILTAMRMFEIATRRATPHPDRSLISRVGHCQRESCGRFFFQTTRPGRYCSPACRHEEWNEVRREKAKVGTVAT